MFAQHTQSSGKMSIDKTLDHLIQTYFSEMYLEKKAYIEADMLRKSRCVHNVLYYIISSKSVLLVTCK